RLGEDTLPTRATVELADGAGRDVPVAGTAESSERELAQVREETGWNITHAAARLRITRNTTRARIAGAGLRPPRERVGIRPVEVRWQFGSSYAAYRANVRRWWPRPTPGQGTGQE